MLLTAGGELHPRSIAWADLVKNYGDIQCSRFWQCLCEKFRRVARDPRDCLESWWETIAVIEEYWHHVAGSEKGKGKGKVVPLARLSRYHFDASQSSFPLP